jgi:glycosyltransferase involved in cell wall biosynthesis
MMRIGVNLIPLRPRQMGGHEFYVGSLLTSLLAQDTSNRYFLFTAWWNHDAVDFPRGRYRKILVVQRQEGAESPPQRDAKGLGRLRGFLSLPLVRRLVSKPCVDLHDWVRRLNLDLWFCPMTNLDPRQLSIPTVITIPDIQQEYYPEFFTRAELRERALMYRPSCQEATAVIGVSRFSKTCMVEKYALPSEKVHCVYEAGVERVDDPSSVPTPEELRGKYRLPATYALYPANMWAHKNHQMLILALHRLRQLYGIKLSLVLTGDDMGQWPRLEALARHLQLQEQVHYLGYVEAKALPGLYRSAAMLVFPSLFEGFGMPLVEAMALGCPIAAANTTSIPEVVGDAALLFDPRNPDAVASASYRLLVDEALRQTLIARGREQAARFSWEKAADETRQVFEWARAQRIAVRPVSRAQRCRIEGIYSDGWAVRRVRLYLPYLPEMKAVKIDGFSHYLSYPLAIQMKIDGGWVQELSLAGPGKFAFVGQFRGSRRAMSGVEIEFSTEKDFSPAKVERSSDTRQLSYRIEKLSLICMNDVEIPLYGASWAP